MWLSFQAEEFQLERILPRGSNNSRLEDCSPFGEFGNGWICGWDSRSQFRLLTISGSVTAINAITFGSKYNCNCITRVDTLSVSRLKQLRHPFARNLALCANSRNGRSRRACNRYADASIHFLWSPSHTHFFFSLLFFYFRVERYIGNVLRDVLHFKHQRARASRVRSALSLDVLLFAIKQRAMNDIVRLSWNFIVWFNPR